MKIISVFCICLLALASGATAQDRPRLLAMGDSIISWNGLAGASVPFVLGRTLDAEVDQRAVPGAKMVNTSTLGPILGFDIRRQFTGEDYDLILLNGGANDLRSECGCTRCTATLDRLIGPDLTGEIPALLARLSRHSPRIIWLGYYITGRPGPFSGCTPVITELDARMARLAARMPGLTFVDSDPAIDPENDAHFARDDVHPSRLGSARIASLVAEAIAGL